MEKLMTIKEVAEYLHTGHKHRYVYDLIKKEKIPSAKFGNKILLKQQDVEDFVEKTFKLQNQ